MNRLKQKGLRDCRKSSQRRLKDDYTTCTRAIPVEIVMKTYSYS
jgi:hypothetical protein